MTAKSRTDGGLHTLADLSVVEAKNLLAKLKADDLVAAEREFYAANAVYETAREKYLVAFAAGRAAAEAANAAQRRLLDALGSHDGAPR